MGLENQGQLPGQSWVSKFAKRHKLKICKCSILSKGRAIVSPQDVARMFADVGKFSDSKSELKEAMKDPQYVFNQDETSIKHGMSDQYVLTMKGDKQVYSVKS